METIELNSTGILIHLSSPTGDSAAKWSEGAARKGNYGGKRAMSAVFFDGTAIAQALDGKHLLAADLVFRRDAAFGLSPLSVCVAPGQLTAGALSERYMSRSEVVGKFNRRLHKCCVIDGETATFHIPGATLRAIGAGEVSAFLLYQEEDGTGDYCRLSTEAVLQLTMSDNGWAAPVWTRSVSAGDVISSETVSHVADLRELEFYINIRRRKCGLQDMDDIGAGRNLGAFAAWADVIGELQEAVDDILEYEGRTYEWAEPAAGALPQAAVIENLRGAISGGGEMRADCAAGYTAGQTSSSKSTAFRTSLDMTWAQETTLQAGQSKTSTTTRTSDGQVITVTIYKTAVCCWPFVIQQAVTINTAAVELTVKEAETEKPHITLFGIELASPDGSYAEVFYDTPIGEADCAVGDITRIDLTPAGVNLLRDGTICGVGVRYDSERTVFAKAAGLLINL
jgi:hypothetical protein